MGLGVMVEPMAHAGSAPALPLPQEFSDVGSSFVLMVGLPTKCRPVLVTLYPSEPLELAFENI